MNIAKLKNYAPQARRDFIQAVTDRAAYYGLTAARIEPVAEQGGVAIIAGRAFPSSVAAKRKKLEDLIHRDGFIQTMEALAYTWFNRFVAIRFMELHGYLDHGYRVLSHPDLAKTIPEILEFAEHVDMPGLNKERVIDLKLDGNKDPELYQMLLLAQCRALHSAMPFLFEAIDDETELVLPENLLHSDSIIQNLVANSDPEDWQEVEVLGWLYQFYISERKDEVMGRKSVVPAEDIPAVTQLFTPHWIVRYLIENSLGRLWLLNRPGSRLREHMPYYIESEQESDFLKITKPEEIRICDPACGSGHMLTYAFDLLTLIYEEEGYARAEIPAIILNHNLYGLDICPRAAQLAGLALVLKARERSHRFFQQGRFVQPHIIELRNVGFADNELRDYIDALALGDHFTQAMFKLLNQFKEAKNFGSLIKPCFDKQTIASARSAVEAKDIDSQLFLRETHLKVLRVFEQAEALTQQYHVVVANPPYMGSNKFNASLKLLTNSKFTEGKADLYSCFLLRNLFLLLERGFCAMITLPNWMFLGSWEDLRKRLLQEYYFSSFIHNGRGLWGSDFGSCAFILETIPKPDALGFFKRLFDKQGEVNSSEILERRFLDNVNCPPYLANARRMLKIPGQPIAYWVSETVADLFVTAPPLNSVGKPRQGLATGENARFLRYWWEPNLLRIGFGLDSRSSAAKSQKRWFPCNKGGPFRKWYGNYDYVVDWELDGERIRNFVDENGDLRSRPQNIEFSFQKGMTWSTVTIAQLSMRLSPVGQMFETKGSVCFFDDNPTLEYGLAFANTALVEKLLLALAPTADYHEGPLGKLPFIQSNKEAVCELSRSCLAIARADWNSFETSWDFCIMPLLRRELRDTTLEASWKNWKEQCTAAIQRMQELETENNRLFINAYGLEGELKPEVLEEQITLARADAEKDMAFFLSYAVGCMMGRYSLDSPGLILANAGESLHEYLAKVGRSQDQLSFMPDEDGIIPILDSEWFEDDIVARARNFLCATFRESTLQENMRFIEESLGKDLREYFLNGFYKDHLQTYRKRPIYWLFSSGKQKAFQCLVYLHRYNEGTLARMRTEYVIKLQGKIATRIEQLPSDIETASSTSHRKKLEKERDKLKKQQVELQQFDEKLRHYADLRISLDLDDGIKVNYGKFGDLLAEVKAVTGGSDE